MSIEIRKVVRQIIAPMTVFLPCVALMALEPAIAGPQRTNQNSSQSAGKGTTKSALHTIEIEAPEHAVATISNSKVAHVSPGESLLGLAKNVPGFNVIATGPANLSASSYVFTLDGFNSNQVGTTFDGVPIINVFLGGIYGKGDNHAVTPLTAGQITSVQVFSGANTAAQTSVDSLGGTINFAPKMPTKKFGVQVSGSLGSYAGHGSLATQGFQVNSGSVASLGGFRVLASYQHTHIDGYSDNVFGHVNSYYLSAVQPTEAGHVSFVLVENDERARTQGTVPLPILQDKGPYWDYPTSVSHSFVRSKATTAVLTLKSLLNPITIGDLKFFYNGTANDRTGYGNVLYSNGYLGYRMPTMPQSCSALNGFLPTGTPATFLPQTYDCQAATQLFGSAAAGSQYQRYINNYYNTGALGHLDLLLPHNVVTVGAGVMTGWEISEEAWYGSQPVPVTDGYDMAWLDHDHRDQYYAFIQDNISLLGGSLHIYPSDKYNYVHMFTNNDAGYYYQYSGEVHDTYVFNEPSLGVTYNFAKHYNAYVNFGRTYKAPAISALYAGIGPTQIPAASTVQPEYVDSIDAGVRYKGRYGSFTAAVFDRQFQNIFSFFYNDITGITKEYNSGAAQYKGFTLGGDVALPYHLTLEANYGYTDARYTTNFSGPNGSATSGQWRPDVPEDTGNLGLEYAHGPWYASLRAHLVGPQYLAYDTGSTSTTRLPAYTTLGANVGYEWKVDMSAVKDVKADLHADNVLDSQHILYGYVQTGTPNYTLAQYQPPFFVGLTLTANFGS